MRGSVRIFGATLENGNGFVLDRMAVAGSEMSQMLLIRPEILDMHLRSRKPDVWIMMFGSNDGYNETLTAKSYAKKVSTLLKRFQKSLPDTPCILIGPMDSGLPRWRRQRRARKRLQMIRWIL